MTYPVDWWYERKNEMISLVHANSPVYVYNEEATMLANIIGQNGKPWNGLCYVKKLAPVKEGDILLITNAGAYGPETDLSPHFRGSISEHYLRARRICQVPI
ncbi:MAG: hypothetical protein JRI52_01735 [Deltaproteobacteria bacterium]|nr:hypothetical protein [Deltaproteobacteria bacterium]